MTIKVDVAIIGGGPAGSTVGTLLKKYNPELNVLIVEREQFPRDHVGESLLPIVCHVLDEMDVWDKVEAANFPVKIGATYRWGRTDDLWDFEFLEGGNFHDQARPGKFAGQRKKTAFQVDRAIYDEILLNHAESLGCSVRQGTQVRTVAATGDRVDQLTLDDGTTIEAKHYVDASGSSGVLRRSLGVEVQGQTNLQNIAVWDYWRNAQWAVKIGIGGTRIQILSLKFGWVWFIPLGPDRTSIGLVVPADYYKNCGEKPEELYLRAIQGDPKISRLIQTATRENKFSSTKDWSYLADRLAGENWFLAGEVAGFADPILSAGLSLTQMGARDVAYTILALEEKTHDPLWLRSRYSDTHRKQIKQHIRFADYWYTHNGIFSDLKDHAKNIAGDAGLNLTPEEAWGWFGQGGFIDHNGVTGVGSFSLSAAKNISAEFAGGSVFHAIVGKTHFQANLDGAEEDWFAELNKGKITRHPSYRRGEKTVSRYGLMGWMLQVLATERSYTELAVASEKYLLGLKMTPQQVAMSSREFFDNLEAMVSDGWVTARTVPGATAIPPLVTNSGTIMHPNRDPEPVPVGNG